MKGIILTAALLLGSWMLLQRPATLTLFDVGQGLSLLFQNSDGWQLLYDGGLGDRVLPELGTTLPPWDNSIDLVVVSHLHRDHLEGLIEVLKRYRVAEVGWYDSGADGEIITAWRAALTESGARVTLLTAGWQRFLGDGWALRALYPPQLVKGEHAHDSTVVLQLSRGPESLLLTGDLEAKNEQDVLKWCDRSRLARCQRPVTLLQVSHHGARSTTGEDWLQYFTPQLAWISAGTDNSYGHPHAETLARLTAQQIPIWRTDEQGRARWP